MIMANVHNAQTGAPLFDDGFEIVNEAGFAAVEEAARGEAECGVACYIRWCRDQDGQVGYWGPSGASFDPHIYSVEGAV